MKKASPQEGEKGPTNRDCFPGEPGRHLYTLAAPLRAPMCECGYKIHNIYSTLIYIKIHSRMHPIKLCRKKILESSSNEIEQRCIRTVLTTTQAGCITIPLII